MSTQQPDILVILDLELSGYGTEAPKDVSITEMAYIISDLATGARVDYNQIFIMPAGGLDDDFYKRTGFTPELFNENETLANAVARLDEFLYAYGMREHKTFCICTWGSRKLQEYFRADCERQGIKLALHYLHFYDLQEEVAVSVQKGIATNFAEAMAALNVDLNPIRRRSGFDMCEVLESVVQQLKARNLPLLNPKSISPLQLVDQNRPFTTPLPTDLSYGALIRVRGIPFSATVEELNEFFAGYQLASGPNIQPINLLINSEGRPSGEAVVRFATPEIALSAIANRDGQHLVVKGKQDRYLELSKLTEESARQFIQQTQTHPSMRAPVTEGGPIDLSRFEGFVRIRGIPFTATVNEVVAVCLPYFKISKEQVVLGYGNDGRPSGDAYLALLTEEAAIQARDALKDKTMGTRYLEAFDIKRDEFQRVSRGGSFERYPRRGGPPPHGGDHHHHGGSYGYGGQQAGGRGGYGGNPRGERYDRYDRYGDNHHGHHGGNTMQGRGGEGPRGGYQRGGNDRDMPSRVRQQRDGHRGDGPQVLDNAHRGDARQAHDDRRGGAGSNNKRPPTSVLKLRGLPYGATPEDVLDFFADYRMLTVVPMIYNKNHMPIGEAYVEFYSVEEAQRAVREKDRQRMKDRYIELFYVTKADMLNAHQSIPPP